jgi:hypothetical protein
LTEEKNALLYRVAQKSFEEATSSSLGATFHIIISFHLKQKFGKDPYEVLISNPKLFYSGLKEVLGEGAEAVLNLAGTYIAAKYKLTFSVEEFTKMFTKDDASAPQKLSQIFRTIIDQEEQKLKGR